MALPDQAIQRRTVLRFHGDLGDDVLSQHVEAIFRNRGLFDGRLLHGPGHGHAVVQVRRIQGNDAALSAGVKQMAAAADALQTRGDALGAFNLNHQIDAADVDAQFQGGGGNDRRNRALL
ncbi:MAG: hypothetical protein BWY83_00932 [bacterium ADurb.Bin478]|nr:MAG: hypothetical protein BWY83_00932 [bacterium ADurb.Bin478]